MKVLILIRSLDYGGTERQVVTLAQGLRRQGHQVSIAVFYSGGPLQQSVEQIGVTVHDLRKRGRWDLPRFLQRLHALARKERPDVIYSFLQVANLFALSLKVLNRHLRVVWGLRASNMELQSEPWPVRLTYWLEARLAGFVDLVIANSDAGATVATSKGFPAGKLVVVPNGIDTERFAPDARARRKVRSEWNVQDDSPLIGLIGRLNPMKDHVTFLRAAHLLIGERPDVRFACVGDGAKERRASLVELTEQLGLERHVLWMPGRDDIPAVCNALDVLTCSSIGEGFPNVIGEAMACGVPCVVTDVGDCRWIVGDSRLVVPPRDPVAMRDAWRALLDEEPSNLRELGLRMRKRICDKFSVEGLVTSTLEQLATTAR